jgi:hypothetical protein
MKILKNIMSIIVLSFIFACSTSSEDIKSWITNKDIESLKEFYNENYADKDKTELIKFAINETFKQNFKDGIKLFNAPYILTKSESLIEIDKFILQKHLEYKRPFINLNYAIDKYVSFRFDEDKNSPDIKKKDDFFKKIVLLSSSDEITKACKKNLSSYYNDLKHDFLLNIITSKLNLIYQYTSEFPVSYEVKFLSKRLIEYVNLLLAKEINKKAKEGMLAIDEEIKNINNNVPFVLSGYIIGATGKNTYEITEWGLNGNRAILKTWKTIYRTTGRFSLPVVFLSKREVTLKNGFTAYWNEYLEFSGENEEFQKRRSDAQKKIKELLGKRKQFTERMIKVDEAKLQSLKTEIEKMI